MRSDEPRGWPDPDDLASDLPIYDPDFDEDDEDEDEDLDEDGEAPEDSPRTVLITGASGNVGRKLRAAWAGKYDLVLLDRKAGDDPDVMEADLADPDEGWLEYFHGVDTVVHLAANPNEFATWEELEQPNLDALANVFHAAALAGVERVIFASSNHAMGDYRNQGDGPITVDLPPLPDGAYGAAKFMGERLGKSLAHAFDVTFVALRIGWVQRGENRPETLPDDWARSIWLSNADLIRLFDRAVEADLDVGEFVVVNGLSANRGTRWSLAEAEEWLGYRPLDDAWK
jgi:NAD(P)-dependent dehydrogenase (short-subunit alcohol dehydrogenase family)